MAVTPSSLTTISGLLKQFYEKPENIKNVMISAGPLTARLLEKSMKDFDGINMPLPIITASGGGVGSQIASVSVNTATLAVNINAIDPLTGTAFPWVKCSIDGISNTAPTQQTIQLFPGISATLAAANTIQINNLVPVTFQVAASLTMVTTAAQTGVVSSKIGGSKLW